MKAVKALAVVLIVTLAAAALIWRLAVLPYKINILKKRVESQLEVLQTVEQSEVPNPARVAEVREDIRLVRRALIISPTDIDLHMELAALYRFLGQYESAIDTYRRALKYDRRPEIYRNLAESQLAMRDTRGAIESYAVALTFSPEQAALIPADMLPDVMLRSEALVAQLARH